MLYNLHELRHALMTPLRMQSALLQSVFENPFNPWTYTPIGRMINANATMTVRATRKFDRPEFGLNTTIIDGKKVFVEERVIVEKPFCSLLNFKRKTKRNDPKILLVAPMSGHYATLLRGTVEALLPHHDVYVTDWEDARQVPLSEGSFNLDDYITYLREFMSLMGPETHVIAVCQPAVPVLAAVSLMASEKDPNQPLTMTLMGGPIDTRVSKTEVTNLAETRPLKWFENSVLYDVPFYYPGANRRVYPGFLQLSGFMSMNLDTHIGSHMKFYQHLIAGDGDSSDRHKKFYDEYLAVMDIPAEFYLQTIVEVFQKHSLPRGILKWRDPFTDKLVDVRPQDITHTALMTVEGELDDISARGQTTAAHDLCYSLPQRKQFHHFQLGCGHYGIFNGSRWRNDIMPRIRHFIRDFDSGKSPVPAKDLEQVPDLSPERFDHDKHGVIAVRRWLKEHRPESYKNTKVQTKKERKEAEQKSKSSPKTRKKLVPPSQKVKPAQKPKKKVMADLIDAPKKATKKVTKKAVKKPVKAAAPKKSQKPKATKKNTKAPAKKVMSEKVVSLKTARAAAAKKKKKSPAKT